MRKVLNLFDVKLMEINNSLNLMFGGYLIL